MWKPFRDLCKQELSLVLVIWNIVWFFNSKAHNDILLYGYSSQIALQKPFLSLLICFNSDHDDPFFIITEHFNLMSEEKLFKM